MMIAPFEASDPYNAAAAAPFNTVIDAISSGLKSFPREEKSSLRTEKSSPPVKMGSNDELFIGTPSTTYKGWLLPEIEVRFLNTIVVEEPGAPPDEVTLRPETFPCKAVLRLSNPDSAIFLPLTVCASDPTLLANLFMPNSAVIFTSPSV